MTENRVRRFTAADRSACLANFDSNVPQYLHAAEPPEFAASLAHVDRAWGSYLGILDHGQPVTCGGVSLSADPAEARLCWGLVHRADHGRGLGTALMQARLTLALSMPDVQAVGNATCQHSKGFFASFGFRLTGQTPDLFDPRRLWPPTGLLRDDPAAVAQNLTPTPPRAGVPGTDQG